MKIPLTCMSLFLLIILTSACSEKMNLKLQDSSSHLVVEGLFTTDTIAHLVKLSQSMAYTDTIVNKVSGANIFIEDDEGNTTYLTESETQAGSYYTDPDAYALPGRTYTLHIRLQEPIDDFKEYTSVSRANPINSIDSIGLKYHGNWGTKGIWEIKCYYQDPPTREYYMCNIILNGSMVTDSLTEKIVVDDRLFNGNYTYGISVGFLNQSKADEVLKSGDLLVFQAASIDANFAEFIWTAQQEAGIENPFIGGTPSNVYSNISNGAIGYFCACSVSYADVTY